MTRSPSTSSKAQPEGHFLYSFPSPRPRGTRAASLSSPRAHSLSSRAPVGQGLRQEDRGDPPHMPASSVPIPETQVPTLLPSGPTPSSLGERLCRRQIPALEAMVILCT